MVDAWESKKDEKWPFQYKEMDNFLVYTFDKLSDLKI